MKGRRQAPRSPADPPRSSQRTGECVRYERAARVLHSLLHALEADGRHTPPVQGRIFAYMGLTLYESVVDGMPHNRSIASSLHGIGALPANHGTKYRPLVASERWPR